MNHKLYIASVTMAFVALAIVFLLFPRSTYSALEKRDLAQWPEYTFEKLKTNKFTQEVSSWFSDSEPFRDEFMALSMRVRYMLRYSPYSAEEAVAFHAPAAVADEDEEGPAEVDPTEIPDPDLSDNLANENAKLRDHGTIVIGSAPNARAVMAYGGRAEGGEEFAAAANTYAERYPTLRVYALVAPLASEFYTPEKARNATKPQLPTIRHIYGKLKGVKGVDAYTPLANHTSEDIYLRTDHHWAPRGAFYAAEALAKAAGVPFRPLSDYEERRVRNYVGTMYGYTKDMAIKNSPEDFIYYVPKNAHYTATFWNFAVNSSYRITKEYPKMTGPFFAHYKDGSGAAYSTFMGGDMKITKVTTDAPVKRRILIIKDSYGNAVPGYLFYSFEEVHVVDFRYFPRNMSDYIRENGITDLAFVVNVFNAYSKSTARKILSLLQSPTPMGAPDAPTVSKSSPANSPSEPSAPKTSSEPSKSTESPVPAEPSEPSPSDPAPAVPSDPVSDLYD